MDTRYALLDTDFISKANLARNGDSVLADLVLNFDGYEFFCHEKIKEELSRHSVRETAKLMKPLCLYHELRLPCQHENVISAGLC